MPSSINMVGGGNRDDNKEDDERSMDDDESECSLNGLQNIMEYEAEDTGMKTKDSRNWGCKRVGSNELNCNLYRIQ